MSPNPAGAGEAGSKRHPSLCQRRAPRAQPALEMEPDLHNGRARSRKRQNKTSPTVAHLHFNSRAFAFDRLEILSSYAQQQCATKRLISSNKEELSFSPAQYLKAIYHFYEALWIVSPALAIAALSLSLLFFFFNRDKPVELWRRRGGQGGMRAAGPILSPRSRRVTDLCCTLMRSWRA